MGRCLSLSENPAVVTARTTALDKKCFKSRLVPEGSPQSFNFDASPYDIENPPEINQKSTFLTTMNHEISNALASLDNLKQSINECQRFQEAWSSVLRCFRKEKYIPCSKYPETLFALKEYRKTAGNFFDKIDAKDLQEVISNKETVASSLDNEMSKIKEELNFYNKWRKYLKVTYIIIVTVILVTAIALQAVTLRRATIAVITVTGIKEIEACIGSFWDDQKLNLESKKKVIKKARRHYSAVMDDMVTIPLLVDVIKIHIGSVKEKVEFVVGGGEEAVEHGVVEIIEMKDVTKETNTLQENVELCKRQAQKANREFSIIISEEIM